MTNVCEKPFREISVVFPAFNEEANLPETLDRTINALEDRFDNFEVIVVDDASTDRTAKLLAEYAERNPQVRVLQNDYNQGAGASMLRGMQEATYDLVINNAMDYPFDCCDLDKLCSQLDRADVVVAARDGRPGYSFYRHVLSLGNRLLLRLLFRLPVTDCNFVQLYRRKVLESADFVSRSAGFLPAEMLIRACDQGYRTAEVRIPYHARQAGTSVMGRPGVAWKSLCEMLAFWCRRLRVGCG